MKILSLGVILFALCSCGTISTGLGRAKLPSISGGNPNPKHSSDREENEKTFGVFGQVVTMKYRISETKEEDICVYCNEKTTLVASDIKINGRGDIVGKITVCKEERCLKKWVEKFVGFKIDKMKSN